MPAAAVIPAPIAYIKVVAVKKLVVGFLVCTDWARLAVCARLSAIFLQTFPVIHFMGLCEQIFYLEKIRVFQAGLAGIH